MTIRPGTDGGLDPAALIRFVAVARVDLLAHRVFDGSAWQVAGPTEVLNRKQMAETLGFPGGQTGLARFLAEPGKASRDEILDAEHRLHAFAIAQRGAAAGSVNGFGWLAAYWQEVNGLTGVGRPAVQLANWFADLAEDGPLTTASALVLGEGLLGLLQGAASPEEAAAIWAAHQEPADRTMRALVSVATRPPRGGSMPAAQLAAQLGTHVIPVVAEHLHHSAVGFRAGRILSLILTIARTTTFSPRWWSPGAAQERAAVWALLCQLDAERDALPDPYPARSLWVEAMREVCDAREHGCPGWMADDALSRLRQRLRREDRPARERRYAAYCVYREVPAERAALSGYLRSIDDGSGRTGFAFLAGLLDELGREGKGLEALLLEGAAGRGLAEIDLVERVIEAGHHHLGNLPESVEHATVQLVRYALLSPDGTMRRKATEALREAGVTSEAGKLIGRVLHDRAAPRWLAEVAAFVLGQLADPAAVDDLEAAVRYRGDVAHAALWALGDIATRSDATVSLLLDVLGDPDRTVAERRAATYALAGLRSRSVQDGLRADQAQVLRRLCDDGDRATALLARWGYQHLQRVRLREQSRAPRELWGVGPHSSWSDLLEEP